MLVALLALPFLLWQNSWWEWATPLWLLQRQAAHVSAHGVPTFFLHTTSEAFNPFLAFYGGFTLSVLAYPAALFGAWPVFVAATVAAMVGGYLGIWWTARNLGLSHRLAVLPALIFSTTPYLLSDLYGRGAWAELVAVNAAAMMLGALTALVWHPDRHPARALATLAACGALIAGTHNVTLLLSALALPLILLAVLPLAPRTAAATGAGIIRRLALAAGAAALGIGLTGAWLVPSLWLGPDTWVAGSSLNDKMIRDDFGLTRLANVLSPWPAVPHELPGRWIYTQAPVLAIVWALAALAVATWSRRRAPDRVVATAAALTVLGAALLLLTLEPRWWLSFPSVVKTAQFPFRVLPYLTMVAALAAAVGLTATHRERIGRWLTGGLVLVVAAQLAVAAWVVIDSKASATFDTPPARASDIRAQAEPASFSIPGLMTQFQFHVTNDPARPDLRTRPVPVRIGDRLTSDTGHLQATGHVGDRRRTSVVWSPLIRMSGDARITGHDRRGLAIVTVTHTDAVGRWSATARPRCGLCPAALESGAPWQRSAGPLLSLLSAIALGAAGLARLRRRRRVRRSPDLQEAPAPSENAREVSSVPTG
ncbi:MAG TPA: hypothetical protein VGO71_06250 [Baekduia sp.]|nr:hypothetical protein [Baekduia sp.]